MQLIPHFVCLIALTATARADFTGPYQLQNFAKSTFENGFSTGSTTLTPPGGASQSAVFGYSIFDDFGVEETLGTLSATAAAAGTISFDYHYTGFHAYFQAQAQFQVLVNDVVVLNLVDNQPASAGFTYSGNASFAVQQGDTFAFRVGGSHFDSNGNLFPASPKVSPTALATMSAPPPRRSIPPCCPSAITAARPPACCRASTAR